MYTQIFSFLSSLIQNCNLILVNFVLYIRSQSNAVARWHPLGKVGSAVLLLTQLVIHKHPFLNLLVELIACQPK